jgi:hypothetical protein
VSRVGRLGGGGGLNSPGKDLGVRATHGGGVLRSDSAAAAESGAETGGARG